MDVSLRSIITAGISTTTATAIVFAPTLPAPAPAEPTVRLAAAVQPLAQQEPVLSISLASPLGPVVTPGTITLAPAALAIPIAPSIADTIDGIYIAVEPWVRYGFQVATDLLAWVPAVGWLSGQIMVFYTFGESIVHSAVFNFTDWLRGQGGVASNLVDFGVDVFWSFVYLGIDEWNYFLPPLPPLPIPIPPRPPLDQFTALDTLTGPDVQPRAAASDLLDALHIPVRDGISVGVDALRGALDPIPVGRIVGLIGPVLNDRLTYFLGLPVGAETNGLTTSPETIETPPIEKAPLAPVVRALDAVQTDVEAAKESGQTAPDGPTTVAETVLNSIPTADAAEAAVTAPRKVTRGVLRDGAEAVSKADTDVTAARRDADKTSEAAAKAPRTVAKGVHDGVRKAAAGVRKAVRGSRPSNTEKAGADAQ